ncbi:MAG: dienelactone hydrolase family protein [Spirochaetales bacterium]|nr:dienelactone hydrolase family protein [Spirochaetales bacterium]
MPIKRVSISPLIVLLLSSCSLINQFSEQSLSKIPDDTGGEHRAVQAGTTESPYGYYIYLPGGYEGWDGNYPLLLFLHGSGEKGDSSEDITLLDSVLKNGPPALIESNEWSPLYPMIVASPQSSVWWNAATIQEYIDYLRVNYQIDPGRIYLSGLSMGGYGTFSYLTTYGNGGDVAAAVPICGGGNVSQVSQCSQIPIWAFHGESDTTVDPSKSIDFVEAYNEQTPEPDIPALITLYPGVGHNSWSRTYSGSGMGTESENYDSFDTSIYSWMLQYSKQ